MLSAALVIVLLASLLAAVWLRELRYSQERTHLLAQQGAVMLEHRVSDLLDKVDAALQALAVQFFNMHDRGQFRAEEFAQFLALQRIFLPELSTLTWIELDTGRGLDCSVRAAPAAREPALQMLCDAAPRLLKADDGGLIVLGPLTDGAARDKTLVLVRRLGGPMGSTAGVVCATLAVSEFSRPMGWTTQSSQGMAALWSRDLSPVWQLPRSDGAQTNSIIPAALVAALGKNPVNGTFSSRPAGGDADFVAAYRSLYRYPFYVVFEQPVIYPIDGWLMYSLVVFACCLLILAATAVLCLGNFRMARCLEHWVGNIKGFAAGASTLLSKRVYEGERALMPFGSTGLTGLRVLVVDDDAANREIARAILAPAGARVALAADGFEALAWLERNCWEVDIVLMDIQMPGMDGCEAVRRIRRIPAGKNLPVAAISAGIYPTQREAVFAAGMNAFIAKPVEPSTVLAVVSSLVSRCGMARDLEGRHEAGIASPGAAIQDDQHIEDLPGLHVRKGLATWKDPEIYCRYLKRFARDHKDGVESLLGLEPQAALRAVHKLRVSAATLALREVAAAAAGVEQALCTGGSLGQALGPLREALGVAQASIARYAVTDEPVKSWLAAARAMDAKTRHALLSDLHDAWRTHEFEQVEPVLSTLTAALGAEATEKLWAALHDLDFHAGAIVTSKMASSLQVPDKIEPL